MVPYSLIKSGHEARRQVLLVCLFGLAAAISFGTAASVNWLGPLLNGLLPTALTSFSIPAGATNVVIPSLGVLAVYHFLFRIYDRWIWNTWLGRTALPMPDISGVWLGTLDRQPFDPNSGMEMETALPVVIRVKQTSSRISYRLDNEADNLEPSDVEVLGLKEEKANIYSLRESYVTDKENMGASLMKIDLNVNRMTGKYVSTSGRHGVFHLTRERSNAKTLTATIKKLISSTGEPYYAAEIKADAMQRHIQLLKKSKHIDDWKGFLASRQDRDGDHYHMTLVSPPEYRGLSAEQQELLGQTYGGKPITLRLSGIGQAKDEMAEDWYVVAQSPFATFIRQAFNLPNRDLHVTLGFIERALHSHDKGPGTILLC